MRSTITSAIVFLASSNAIARDVTVKVVGDDAKIEEARVASDASVEWETICVSPCITHAAPGAVLRAVAGLPSDPFELRGEDVVLRALARPDALGDASTALLILGAVFGGGATVAIPVGAVMTVQQSFHFCLSACPPPDTSGSLLLGTGAALGVVSIIMLAVGAGMRPAARARLEMAARAASMQFAF
jgi:hypothetical protein